MSEKTTLETDRLVPFTGASVGKYEIRRVVAQGGFGTVFEGWDPLIKRQVAVKTCSLTDPEIRSRFEREAQIAGNLDHPSIVRVFDFGVDQGFPYLVQELLSGTDLDGMIQSGTHITAPEKLLILIQIARGLEYAHGQGVIHRDIKPANVRILDDGSVKLMDFGIAMLQQVDSRHTLEGMTAGTAAYLAPEQIRGDPASERTDIFSYGVLAYELLSGKRPFAGDTISTVLFQIVNDSPPALVPPWCQASPALSKLVHRCLEKAPNRRWPDMTTLLKALERLRDTTPRASAHSDELNDSRLTIHLEPEIEELTEIEFDTAGPSRESSGPIQLRGSATKRRSRWPWAALPLAVLAAFIFWQGAIRGDLRLPDLVKDRGTEPSQQSASTSAAESQDETVAHSKTQDAGSSVAPGLSPAVQIEEIGKRASAPRSGSQVDRDDSPAQDPAPATVRISNIWHPLLKVAIDGGPARRLTAVNGQELAAGKHDLLFSLDTSRYRALRKTTIRLTAGENRLIACPLPAPGALTVQAGLGARQGVIRIDGRVIGKSPIRRIYLEPGNHSVDIVLGSSVLGRTLTTQATLESRRETILTFDPRRSDGVFIRHRALDLPEGEDLS
jgi:serine/threonine protein kinase